MNNNDAKEIKIDLSGKLTPEQQEFIKKVSSISRHFTSSKGENETAEFKFDITDNDLKEVFNFKEEEITKLHELINSFNTHEERKNIKPFSNAMEIHQINDICGAVIENYEIFKPGMVFNSLSLVSDSLEVAFAFWTAAYTYKGLSGDDCIEYKFLKYVSLLPCNMLDSVIPVVKQARSYSANIYIQVDFNNPCGFQCHINV